MSRSPAPSARAFLHPGARRQRRGWGPQNYSSRSAPAAPSPHLPGGFPDRCLHRTFKKLQDAEPLDPPLGNAARRFRAVAWVTETPPPVHAYFRWSQCAGASRSLVEVLGFIRFCLVHSSLSSLCICASVSFSLLAFFSFIFF